MSGTDPTNLILERLKRLTAAHAEAMELHAQQSTLMLKAITPPADDMTEVKKSLSEITEALRDLRSEQINLAIVDARPKRGALL